MGNNRIRVALVEDDPMVQEVNRQFIERVDGFEIVGAASDGAEGMRLIRRIQPDLVFLDIYMPVQDGMETLHQIRREQLNTDVIMITAAKDVSTVQGLLRRGVFDYIIKPFKFERVKQSLENYRAFQFGMEKERQISQDRLDHILHKSGPVSAEARKADTTELPKGLNALTLKQVMGLMVERQVSVSAEEVADGIGVARVTARRYLDYLEKTGRVSLDIQYGGVGRPVNRYRLE